MPAMVQFYRMSKVFLRSEEAVIASNSTAPALFLPEEPVIASRRRSNLRCCISSMEGDCHASLAGTVSCEAVCAEAISIAANEIASTGKERRSRNDTCQGFPTLRKP